jgi:hypothetical protein
MRKLLPQLIFIPFLILSLGVQKMNGQLVDHSDIRIFPSQNQQTETHISINKTNPQNLLASCNTLLPAPGGSYYQQGYYYSFDGGATWNGADMLQNSWLNSGGDPSTAFDNNGKAFIAALKYGTGEYFVQTSLNGGVTWTNLTSAAIESSLDKQHIAVDNQSSSPYVNNFYCSWHTLSPYRVRFNRSINGGSTFSTPITLYSGIGFSPDPQIGPNGEVYVCWSEYDDNHYYASGVGFTKSLDGGQNFESSHRVFSYNGFRESGPNSDFGGIKVADWVSMAVDKSNSSTRGRIYIAFPTDENSTEIHLRYSDDQGETWSQAIRVSNSTFGFRNFVPSVSVDDCSGDVWVVYHSIDEPGMYVNTYVGESLDGGLTWVNQKVSDVSHLNHPMAEGYIGDYIGIAAYQGKAYPIWSDNRNGNYQIYTSPIYSYRTPTFQNNPTTICNTSQRFYINPVCGAQTYTYTIVGSSNVVFASNGLQTITTTDQFVDINFLNNTNEVFTLKVKADFPGYSTAEVTSTITVGIPIIDGTYITNGQELPMHIWFGNPNTDYNNVCNLQMTYTNLNVQGAASVNWSLLQAVPSQPIVWSQNGNNLNFYLTSIGQTALFRINAGNICGNKIYDFGFKSIDCNGGSGCKYFTVSPNPTTGIVKVSITDKPMPCSKLIARPKYIDAIIVYDRYSNIVRQQLDKMEQTSNFDLVGLKPGIYIIEVRNGAYSERQQLIIQ